ncbi:hypothetical protein EDD15DRAFT_2370108 [Pisolithus albus]|nr:hypothetical protein EDD15DRAFT_2370521 [Pisolithus albus]KAI5989494.1 hypothetical protein EDD15DRAFT_2370525 [Pisolithus albus]KAI5990205.1 hypothetical protein EDD15DRAFT_2370108 [Pisolithus albus]
MARTATLHGKRVRPKLSNGQKEERRARQMKLASDIASAQRAYVQEARDIARNHGRSLKWTRVQLLKSQNLRDRRRVNSWNAFIRAKLREANAGRDRGDRVILTQFVARNKDDLRVAYKNLTPAQQEAYNAEVRVARDTKVMVVRSNPKAVSHTVSAAFANMDREWTALCAQTGLEGFYIAVRGTVEDLPEPKVFFTQKAENFVRTVLDIEPRRLALRLESWVVSGLDAPIRTKHQRPLNKLISECRALIQEELDYILTKKVSTNVKMNYTNYERRIVERYGVMLTGWPFSGTVRNPSKIGGRAEVEKLLDALNSEACKWVRLTDEELRARVIHNKERQARGEAVYHPRRTRTTKALTTERTRTSSVSSAATSDSNSD